MATNANKIEARPTATLGGLAKKIANAFDRETEARAAGKKPCRAASDSVTAARYFDEDSDRFAHPTFTAAVAERETEELLDFCGRNLNAGAWLPADWQRRLYTTLVKERIAHTKTRDELGAEVVRVRRAYNEVCRRIEGAADTIGVLRDRLAKATKKTSTKGAR